jgi:hypothetical protein
MKPQKTIVMTDHPGRARDLVAAFDARRLPPGVYTTTVTHDDGCTLLAGWGACTCTPQLTIVARRMNGTSEPGHER